MNGASGGTVPVDHLIVTMPSVVFDAVCVFGGSDNVAQLTASGDAVHFVREAFKHAKPIAAMSAGIEFLTTAGVLAGTTKLAGVSTCTDQTAVRASFITDLGAHRRRDRVTKDSMAA